TESLSFPTRRSSDLGELAGVLIAVNDLAHIVAFYVKEKFQKRGVGKALFERLSDDSNNSYVTVNASPYAVEIYRKLGFIEACETDRKSTRLNTSHVS